VEGKTGFVFSPENQTELAKAIERYFASDLHTHLNSRRSEIRDYAIERHSWDVVGQTTMSVYASLLDIPATRQASNREASSISFDMKAPS